MVLGVKGREVIVAPQPEQVQFPANLGFSPPVDVAIPSRPSSGAGSDASPASSGGGGISSAVLLGMPTGPLPPFLFFI